MVVATIPAITMAVTAAVPVVTECKQATHAAGKLGSTAGAADGVLVITAGWVCWHQLVQCGPQLTAPVVVATMTVVVMVVVAVAI